MVALPRTDNVGLQLRVRYTCVSFVHTSKTGDCLHVQAGTMQPRGWRSWTGMPMQPTSIWSEKPWTAH